MSTLLVPIHWAGFGTLVVDLTNVFGTVRKQASMSVDHKVHGDVNSRLHTGRSWCRGVQVILHVHEHRQRDWKTRRE